MDLLLHVSLASAIYCYVDKVASEEASVKIYVLVTFHIHMQYMECKDSSFMNCKMARSHGPNYDK